MQQQALQKFVLPAAMRANVVTAFGVDFEKTYKVVNDMPLPIKSLDALAPNDVLINVQACGVNPVDYKMASGNFRPILSMNLPGVVGNDVSGTVVACGSKVSRVKLGDEVLAFSSGGGNAEYVLVKEDVCAVKPAALSFVEAASLPVVVTTMVMCFEKAQIKSEHKVLIHGGSGGTGSWGVLLAKHYYKCAKVFATCSTKNVSYVQSLGADRVIDYTTEQFELVCKDENIDVVIDTVGETEIADKSMALLALNKNNSSTKFITITTPSYTDNGGLWNTICFGSRVAWKSMMGLFGPSFNMVMAHGDGKILHTIAEWLSNNRDLLAKIPIKTYSLEEVAQAHAQIKSKRTVGKLVVQVAAEQQQISKQ